MKQQNSKWMLPAPAMAAIVMFLIQPLQAEVLEQTAHAHRHTLHLAAMYFDIHARQKLGTTIDLDSAGLSRREVACLQWTACGKTTWDIGETLGISRSGVAWHLRSARRKLGAATLSQAVAAALKRKLIEL